MFDLIAPQDLDDGPDIEFFPTVRVVERYVGMDLSSRQHQKEREPPDVSGAPTL